MGARGNGAGSGRDHVGWERLSISLPYIKQTKPKYWAGAIMALYGIGHCCPSSQRRLKKGPWDFPSVGRTPSCIKSSTSK